MDWSAMSEHGCGEAKRGNFALAASSFLDILKSYWIAEPRMFIPTSPAISSRSPCQRKATCPAQ